MENDTVHYLTSIINLLQKKPEVQKIITLTDSGRNSHSGRSALKTPERSYESTKF